MNIGCTKSIGLLLFLAITAAHAQSAHRIIVSAGEHDRTETVVSFELPSDVTNGGWQLRDSNGASTPLQIHANRGWVIARNLKHGQNQTYELERAAVPAGRADGVAISQKGGALEVNIGGKHAFAYQGEKTPLPSGFKPEYQRGGYIDPVLTPSGIRVDDDYPPNHRHHHGIWSVWTKTEFEGRHPDFWNMGDKTGTEEPRGFRDIFSGPVVGGFHAEHQMIDLSAKPPEPAVNEQWDVMAYNIGKGSKPYFVFDIVIHQQCARASPLVLPDYRYGGIGFRGNRQWDGAKNCEMITSDQKDRTNGNGTRAAWCFIGGKVNGKEAGITIFCGPDSFRAPQPVRLHPTEPFFCYAPPAMGEFTITPQQPYFARYRFLVCDGAMDKSLIQQIAEDYCAPVEVKVE